MALSTLKIAADQCKTFLAETSPVSLAGYGALGYLTNTCCRHCIWTPFKLYVLAQLLPGVNLASYGEWAIVTGASQGIGELRRKFGICLQW